MAAASLKDRNGDGISELFVGAVGKNDGGDSHGACYILFLNSNGSVKSFNKFSDTTGSCKYPF